jgi:hypothetical protein
VVTDLERTHVNEDRKGMKYGPLLPNGGFYCEREYVAVG